MDLGFYSKKYNLCRIISKQYRIEKKLDEIYKKLNLALTSGVIIGPYLQLIKDVLSPPDNTPLFKQFIFNIQYYNQANYYSTYAHLFSDTTGGPYGMTNSASCQSILNYFKTIYGETIPSEVLDSIIVGKPLTSDAGDSGYVDLNTLDAWFQTAASSNINYGGYMLWSAGYYSDEYPSDKLVTNTFANVDAKYKVIYIGSGSSGSVYTAQGEKLFAQASDPDGSNAKKILESYAGTPQGASIKTFIIEDYKIFDGTGFNVLILAFWNFDNQSDWIIDWSSIEKANQKSVIDNIHAINPDCKVLVSGGGAYGNVGPNSGVSGSEWGTALAEYAVNNSLDGVDLDLEGAMLGTQWNLDQYEWLKDAVIAINKVNPNLAISFAPVAPLCANPNQ